MARALFLAVAVAAVLSACNVVPPDSDVPVDQQPQDQGGGDDGGGGGGGGGVPIARELVQLWAVRIDPGVANLAASYDALVVQATRAAAAAGFVPERVLLADLYRPEAGIFAVRFPYEDSWGTWHVDVEGAIRAAAASSGPPPSRCTSDSLLSAGSALRNVVWVCPAAVLAVVVDSAARPVAYEGCGDPAARLAASDPVQWLSAPCEPIALARTRVALVATGEGISADQQRAACATAAGFPVTALDVVAPSPVAFDDPWAAGIGAWAPGVGRRLELCAGIGGGWWSAVSPLMAGWAAELGIPPP